MAQSKNTHKPRVYYSRLSEKEASAILEKAKYNEDTYPEIDEIITESMDPFDGTLYQEPLSIAMDLMDADPNETTPKDIFLFMERAFSDAVEFEDDVDAARNLGTLYFDPHYGNQDYEKACAAFKKGAEHGDLDCGGMYGWCLYYGLGTEKNPDAAFPLILKQSAAEEDPNATFLLGEMYWDGVYLEKDPSAAFHIDMKLLHSFQTLDDDPDENPPMCAAGVLLRVGDYVLNDNVWDLALTCYQRAELICYNRLQRGDHMAQEQLRKAQEGIDRAEEGMERSLSLHRNSSSKKH